jgi:hypothetical protein
MELRAAEPAFRDTLRRFISERAGDTANHESPPGFPSAIQHTIGLEYSVMLHKDGIDQPVDAERHRFHAGDQIRVRIQPLNDLYVYIFFDDQRGCRRCLLPRDKNSPRLARYDQPVELPSDGSVFEFEAAAEQETFTLIATPQPDNDLTSLCDLVCKKRGELSPEERALQADLISKNERALTALETRQQKAVFFQGHLSPQSFSRVAADMKQRGAEDALLVEPPGNKQTSTLVLIFSNSTSPPKLVVRISLKANRPSAAKNTDVPRG